MIARMADSHVAESVIDFHTHVQPHAAAGVAFQQQFGFADPPRNGTPEELLPMMDDAGVRRVLMVPWMPAQDLVDEQTYHRHSLHDVASVDDSYYFGNGVDFSLKGPLD